MIHVGHPASQAQTWKPVEQNTIVPDLMTDWPPQQVTRGHRALMLRKALTHLSEAQRAVAKEEESEDDKKPRR